MSTRASRAARFANTAVEESLLLPFGAAAGVIWANAGYASYERLTRVVHFAVNDIGMAFFFALAMKEVVEATSPGGALSSRRRAATPVLAALGGMVGPAGVYLALAQLTGHAELTRGWAIPCATDIAFSYLAARFVLGAHHVAIPFLLLLAIADDAFGLILLALFYPSGPLRLLEFAILIAVALACAYGLRRRRIRTLWAYLGGAGVLSWVAMFRGGLHPALALVPIVPFLPRARHDPGIYVPAPGCAHDSLSELEHHWKAPVAVMLGAFGLVNAGVRVSAVGAGTWVVLAAVLIGKPLGIVSVAVASRSALPWRDLTVVSCAAAIGFTVALFFATAAFPAGMLLEQVKAGALFTLLGAVLAAVVAMVLRVGRFRTRGA